VLDVFHLFVCGLYWEKRKNMCKYFSGCGYTMRKSWKVLGPELAEHWTLNISHCMFGLYLHKIFSKLGIFFLDFIYVHVCMIRPKS